MIDQSGQRCAGNGCNDQENKVVQKDIGAFKGGKGVAIQAEQTFDNHPTLGKIAEVEQNPAEEYNNQGVQMAEERRQTLQAGNQELFQCQEYKVI